MKNYITRNLRKLSLAAAALALSASSSVQAAMPDPTTYITTVETVGTAAAVVGGAILVYVIGKRLVGKFVR